MIIKKNELFKTNYNNKVYQVAGRWGSDIILSPLQADEEQCLIYTPGEIEELFETGELKREDEPVKRRQLFGRKVANLEELKERTLEALKEGKTGSSYVVTKEIELEDEDFQKFSQDFFEDQPWIKKEDGGTNEKGEIRCIRVINLATGEIVLVNSEGYAYPRYTALGNLSYED